MEKQFKDYEVRTALPLQDLGMPEALQSEIWLHGRFRPPSFCVSFEEAREEDRLYITLHFMKEEGGSAYRCRYYDARLIKQLPPPIFQRADIELSHWEGLFQAIPWKASPALLQGQFSTALENLLAELEVLSSTQEGKKLASFLKFKYWRGSSLERYWDNSQQWKAEAEISQRFYFFEGESGISLQEAYRFLSHRWKEKKWLLAKRQAPETNGGGPTETEVKHANRKIRKAKN